VQLLLRLVVMAIVLGSVYFFREEFQRVPERIAGKKVILPPMPDFQSLPRRVGCWVGFISHEIEISELHVGNLLVGGSVYVSVEIGDNPPMRTKAIELSDGSFLPFSDRFRVESHWLDGTCIFSVVDQQDALGCCDTVARLEIPARTLITHARERKEYFRFELIPEGRRLCSEAARKDERPYAAMRIRDVTCRGKKAANPEDASGKHLLVAKQRGYGGCAETICEM